MRKIALSVIFLLALSAWLVFSSNVSAAPLAQATTPPATATAAAEKSQFPYLALLVLLVPFAIMLWKNSRPGAEKKITAGACLPVIDEEALARQKAKQDSLDGQHKP